MYIGRAPENLRAQIDMTRRFFGIGGRAGETRVGRSRASAARPFRLQARTSERRFISSCVISRCRVFSALPGSDTNRIPSW